MIVFNLYQYFWSRNVFYTFTIHDDFNSTYILNGFCRSLYSLLQRSQYDTAVLIRNIKCQEVALSVSVFILKNCHENLLSFEKKDYY